MTAILLIRIYVSSIAGKDNYKFSNSKRRAGSLDHVPGRNPNKDFFNRVTKERAVQEQSWISGSRILYLDCGYKVLNRRIMMEFSSLDGSEHREVFWSVLLIELVLRE